MNAQQLYDEACNYHFEENYPKALELCMQIIQDYPDSPEVGYAKAKIDKINKEIESKKQAEQEMLITVENKENINSSFSIDKLSTQTFILYVILIPVSILLSDLIIHLYWKELLREAGAIGGGIISIIVCFTYGIVISVIIYKLKQCFQILAISAVILFLLRCLIVFLFSKQLIYMSLITTFIEAILVVLFALSTSFLLRYSEKKYDYAKVRKIPDVDSQMLGKQFDIDFMLEGVKYGYGICGKCNSKIRIFKKGRFWTRNIHVCEKCGAFLEMNPFKAVIVGLAEVIYALLCLPGFGMHMSASSQGNSIGTNLFLLAVLSTCCDGVRRLYSGIVCIVRSALRRK